MSDPESRFFGQKCLGQAKALYLDKKSGPDERDWRNGLLEIWNSQFIVLLQGVLWALPNQL